MSIFLASVTPFTDVIDRHYGATELTKQLGFKKIGAQLLHFRTSDGKEVDFILERQDGSILAIAVKKSESVHLQDFTNIQLLKENVEGDFIGGIILYAGRKAVPERDEYQ